MSYVIIDTSNNEVWNRRNQRWTKKLSKGCLWVAVSHGPHKSGSITTPSAACEKAHEALHREPENFHRRLEVWKVHSHISDLESREIEITA